MKAEVSVRIRNYTEEDLPAILSVQSRNPQAAQWSQADYSELASDPWGLILVVELDGKSTPTLAGFAASHYVMDEAELRNMAVDPAYQRQGIGRELLAEATRRLAEQGVTWIYLEVRASNISAQKFYYSAGFTLRSRRMDYYNNPREDALVLSLDISSTSKSHVPENAV